MKQPDIEKLRRFALVIGLVLFTYFAAVVQPTAPVEFSIFGAKFQIIHPEHIPIGLILASLYSAGRFIFYGMIMNRSPARIRKQMLINKLEDGESFYLRINPDDKKKILQELASVFPNVNKGDVSYSEDTIQNKPFGLIQFKVSITTKLLSRLHDVDYTAPIWLNVLALSLCVYRYIAS